MIAVCGIGSPSGCRKSAVTANQSASAPTIAASAVARTNPTQPGAPTASPHRASRKITVAASRSPVASVFIRRRSRAFSSAFSAPFSAPTPSPASTEKRRGVRGADGSGGAAAGEVCTAP